MSDTSENVNKSYSDTSTSKNAHESYPVQLH